MPKELIIDYWQGKKRLFIWGTAIYNDSFEDTPERLSEFCIGLTHLTVNQQGDPNKVDFTKADVNLVGFQWEQCTEHNCYDQDCKDYSSRAKDMRE
jgi:hypothetical protein